MPKAGKTTLLRKLIEQLKKDKKKVGGFISPEEKIHGTRTGFKVMDIQTNKTGILADLTSDGPMVSKYHVNISSFEDIALPILANANAGKYDIVVIDEIGWMELKSKKFSQALDDLLDMETPLLASLHEDFAGDYEAVGEVFEVRESNREAMYNEILGKVREALARPKEKKMELWPIQIISKKDSAKPKQAKSAAKKESTISTKKSQQEKQSKSQTSSEKEKQKFPSKDEKSKKKPGLVERIVDLFRL